MGAAQDYQSLFAAKLKSSGLTKKEAATLKLSITTGAQMKQQKLPEGYAIKIPYFTPAGKVNDFARFRYLEDIRNGLAMQTDAKPLRYIQRAETINELYLPPLVDWEAICNDTALPLVITEGEFKAACACHNGIATVGLGGVWCFRSAKSGMKSIPSFKWIEWRNREVTIIFDSDAATNPDIRAAENALCDLLTELGAKPRIARLPAIEGQKKTGVDDYIVEYGAEELARVLDQATVYAGAEMLHKLNNEVVYVENPGLVMRLSNHQRMSHTAFIQHAYADWRYTTTSTNKAGVKLVEHCAPQEWIRWNLKSKVLSATYAPGKERFHDGMLNVWPGWAGQPVKGDTSLWEKLLDHLFGNEVDARRWFCQWLAWPIQNPGAKLYTAALLWGKNTGTGKSLVGSTMGQVYGRNYESIDEAKLTDKFNEWAENRQFIMIDDVDGKHNRDNEALIKGMITRHELRLNPKYIPSYTIPDCINYYATANKPDAFFIDDEDRRIFVHEVQAQRLPMEFVDKYVAWMKSPKGVSAMFAWALAVDMKGFRPNAPAMMTGSKAAMIEDCRSELARWVAVLKHNPEEVLKKMGEPQPFEIWRTEDLLKMFDPNKKTPVTVTGMARQLKAGGIVRAANGNQCVTSLGRSRMWLVREPDKYLRAPDAQIGRLYDEERAVFEGKPQLNGHDISKKAPLQRPGKPLGYDLYNKRKEKKREKRAEKRR